MRARESEIYSENNEATLHNNSLQFCTLCEG